MILNVIVFYNKIIECYTTPNFDDHDPEVAAKQLQRSLFLNKDDGKIVNSYRFLDMFCMGTFDDSTGSFNLLKKPVKLLDCSQVLGIDIDAIKAKFNEPMQEVEGGQNEQSIQ